MKHIAIKKLKIPFAVLIAIHLLFRIVTSSRFPYLNYFRLLDNLECLSSRTKVNGISCVGLASFPGHISFHCLPGLSSPTNFQNFIEISPPSNQKFITSNVNNSLDLSRTTGQIFRISNSCVSRPRKHAATLTCVVETPCSTKNH